jgi:hypothetical protein
VSPVWFCVPFEAQPVTSSASTAPAASMRGARDLRGWVTLRA